MSNEGNQPYTPTRLEWLTLKLNAENGIEADVFGYRLRFMSIPKANMIVIAGAIHSPDNEDSFLKKLEDMEVEVINQSLLLGWSSPPKTKIEIQRTY